MLCISINDLIVKQFSTNYPLHQIIFIRSAIAMLVTLVLVKVEGGFKILKTKQIKLHALRAISIFFCNMIFFSAIATLSLATATALFFVAPIFITLLSIPLLGEKVGIRRLLAVIFGFFGVFIMMKPNTWSGSDIHPFIYFLPVIAAMLYAFMQIMTRKLSKSSKPSALAFYIQVTFMSLSLIFGLIFGDGKLADLSSNTSMQFIFRGWLIPKGNELPYFLILGFLAAGVGYFMSKAYSTAAAASVAPFEYVLLPLSIFWGWTFFGDIPDLYIIIGIIFVVGSGLYVLVREKKRESIASFMPKQKVKS
jgi:S-adenosylmethionine uptake transporter